MALEVYDNSVIKHEGKTGDPYIGSRLRRCLCLSFLAPRRRWRFENNPEETLFPSLLGDIAHSERYRLRSSMMNSRRIIEIDRGQEQPVSASIEIFRLLS